MKQFLRTLSQAQINCLLDESATFRKIISQELCKFVQIKKNRKSRACEEDIFRFYSDILTKAFGTVNMENRIAAIKHLRDMSKNFSREVRTAFEKSGFEFNNDDYLCLHSAKAFTDRMMQRDVDMS